LCVRGIRRLPPDLNGVSLHGGETVLVCKDLIVNPIVRCPREEEREKRKKKREQTAGEGGRKTNRGTESERKRERERERGKERERKRGRPLVVRSVAPHFPPTQVVSMLSGNGV